MVTLILSILLIAAGIYLTYVLIKRLSAKNLSERFDPLSAKDSSDGPFDPGSTSTQITESGQILPPPHSDKDD